MRNNTDPDITPYEHGNEPIHDREESGHWMRDRLEQEVGGRPLILYLLMAAGLAVLLLLGIIIWVSARGDGRTAQAICLDISPREAVTQVLAGNVDGVYVIIDRNFPELGPAALQLEMSDNTCRVTPQGIEHRDEMLQVLGAIEFTNTIGENRIRSEYRREAIPAELMATPTPTLDPNEEMSETPTVDPLATEEPAGGPGLETPTSIPAPADVPTEEPTTTP
jgi:hypothetical protein